MLSWRAVSETFRLRIHRCAGYAPSAPDRRTLAPRVRPAHRDGPTSRPQRRRRRSPVWRGIECAEFDGHHGGRDRPITGENPPRASARLIFRARITSRPLPSPNLKSMTANAGAAVSIAARASATLPAVRAAKPREDIARARRSQKTLSSSTTSTDLSSVSAPLGSFIDDRWEGSSIITLITKESAPTPNNLQVQDDRSGWSWPFAQKLLLGGQRLGFARRRAISHLLNPDKSTGPSPIPGLVRMPGGATGW